MNLDMFAIIQNVFFRFRHRVEYLSFHDHFRVLKRDTTEALDVMEKVSIPLVPRPVRFLRGMSRLMIHSPATRQNILL